MSGDTSIEFKDVHFGYADADIVVAPNNVLNGLSFTVQKGHKVAVVGGSGSGKSTVSSCVHW